MILFILQNDYSDVEGLIGSVDKAKLEIEINSISNDMSEEMNHIRVFFRLSCDFNCKIVLLQYNNDPIYVEANSFINPFTLYFNLAHEEDSDSLELLLGRKIKESKILSSKSTAIQEINSRLRILCEKFFSNHRENLIYPNPSIPKLPESLINYEQNIQVEEDKLNRVSQRITPQIPQSFPELYKTVPKSENIVIKKTDPGPPESEPNPNIPEMKIPKIEMYTKYGKNLGPIKRPPIKWDSMNLPENFRIKKTTVIKPLRLMPFMCQANSLNFSFFSNLSIMSNDNIIVPSEQIEEKKKKNKDDPIIVKKENCDCCIRKEFSEITLSCRCLMCHMCISISYVRSFCVKCSFSLSSIDRELIKRYFR